MERKEIRKKYEDPSSIKIAFRKLSTSVQRVSTRLLFAIEEEFDNFHPEDVFNKALMRVSSVFTADAKRIISHKNVFKEVWDVFIIVLAIYNSMVIPLEMSFDLPIFQSLSYQIVDNLLDLIFLADIILTFFTSYISKKGKEIKDQRLIAMNYIPTTRFLYDLLSLLGANVFELINSNFKFLQFCKLFKIARIRRINDFIKNLNSTKDIKALLNLVRMMFILILWLHIQSCVWYYVVMLDKTWFPPLNWATNEITPEIYSDDTSLFKLYTMFCYYSFLFLTLNESGPTSEFEYLISICILLISTYVYTMLYGEMFTIILALSKKKTMYQQKIDTSKSVMNNLGLSHEAQS